MFDNKVGPNKADIFSHIKNSLNERGLLYVLFMSIKVLGFLPFSYLFAKAFNSRSVFMYQKQYYSYEICWYNMTWRNERVIEIPIIRRMIDNYKKSELLEVGNVLKHYGSSGHDVVDKYEKGDGVINEDILDFETDKKYQVAISISTLEHIGQDEECGESSKAIDAIKKIQSLLHPDGEFCFSIPLGYNKVLDTYCFDNLNRFKSATLLKRISRSNRWAEYEFLALSHVRFGHPYPFTNVIFIGIIDTETVLGPTTTTM